MIFESKHNIHDTVLYVHSNREIGDVEVRGGVVKAIDIHCSESHKMSVTYHVIVNVSYHDEDFIEIDEQQLFSDEKDVMKFFKSNIKTQLESVEAKKARLKNAPITVDDIDDLPF